MRDLKEEAKAIFLDALKSIQLDSIIKVRLWLEGDRLFVDGTPINLRDYREVVLIGLGKATLTIARELEAILGDRLSRGILVSNHEQQSPTKSEVVVAGHPLPDENSLKAGERVIRMIQSCRSDSLIIFAISGGGSSLIELPLASTVTLEDLRELNRVLISCGATIREINIVRKHLSQVKGGRLGFLARNCPSLSLFVSDVNPGDFRSIASNPLLPDDATLEEFAEILNRYRLIDRLPVSVTNLISAGAIPALPGEWQGKTSIGLNILLLENADAVSAATRAAEARGFRVFVHRIHSEGEYKTAADELIEDLFALRQSGFSERICLLSGGEFSSAVTGGGFGGRNQEFVLYCAARLAARGLSDGIAVLSCGTDGIDGNSSAVGAVADAGMISRGGEAGLDASSFIAENNSTSFFFEAGGLIVTGPTGNNVRDLRILLMI
jgi:glycerate-2-kinase